MLNRKEKIRHELLKLKQNGDSLYFNMFQDGGAVCYYCQGMYLLFEIPLYGGVEQYSGTFDLLEIDSMIELALSWT